jgi:hypothetical protein
MEKKSLNDEMFLKSKSPHSLDPKIIENYISLSKPSLCTNNSTISITCK